MGLLSRAIESLGKPQPRRNATWREYVTITDDGTIDLSDSTAVTYAFLYRSQPWMQVAVNKYARGIGRLPLKAYQRGEENDRTRLREGDLATLIRRPVPGMSAFDWKSALVGNVGIYGNCIAVMMRSRSDQAPTEIWPFSPIGWRVLDDGTYEYRPKHKAVGIPFEPWQIWHLKFWSTDENGFGLSPAEPLRRTLAVEDAAQRLGVAHFGNGVRPSGVFSTDQKLEDQTVERTSSILRRLHAGVDNAYKPMILEQGLDWKPMSHNLDDSTVIEHRKLTREEVAAVYDLPQPTIGILENANFASVQELHQMLYQDSFGPWTTMIEESFEAQVMDGVPEFENQFVEFDLAEVLRGDLSTRAVAYQRLISGGIYTQNEIRARENLPRVEEEDADILHRPLNLFPDPSADDAGEGNPVGQNGRVTA